jgi:hypothetical protein
MVVAHIFTSTRIQKSILVLIYISFDFVYFVILVDFFVILLFFLLYYWHYDVERIHWGIEIIIYSLLVIIACNSLKNRVQGVLGGFPGFFAFKGW